uniref:Uncharacterized protein n=1 Tax=Chrysotila carterae TaxID=13221 RepID=A0A7S4FCJ2_CHRCT|mmetsp:Transcript_23863/g.52170  ORF Transcript_23863/g.52170 Transcript_23863/m.52170 type:complete len:166 (+) Transcript_23863:231-728(+)
MQGSKLKQTRHQDEQPLLLSRWLCCFQSMNSFSIDQQAPPSRPAKLDRKASNIEEPLATWYLLSFDRPSASKPSPANLPSPAANQEAAKLKLNASALFPARKAEHTTAASTQTHDYKPSPTVQETREVQLNWLQQQLAHARMSSMMLSPRRNAEPSDSPSTNTPS